MSAGIDTRDLDAMARALGHADRAIGTETADAGRRIGKALETEVKRRAGRHGSLARTVRSEVTGSGIAQRVSVYAGPALHLIAGGTAPHVIRATGHPLAMTRAGGSRPFAYATVVHHPGTPADPIMGRALDGSMGQVAAETDRAGGAILDAVRSDARGR